jgi:hypothetical protein
VTEDGWLLPAAAIVRVVWPAMSGHLQAGNRSRDNDLEISTDSDHVGHPVFLAAIVSLPVTSPEIRSTSRSPSGRHRMIDTARKFVIVIIAVLLGVGHRL